MQHNLIAATAIMAMLAVPAQAANVVDEWASVKAPPAPELKAVAVEPKTTALIILDMITPICNAQRYPRCPGTIPLVKTLLSQARAKGVMVVYTGVPNVPKTAIDKELTPVDSELYVQSTLNKFLHTDLEKVLKDKGITALITVGTAAQGAVITTSAAAAELGFKVIVPVDVISAQTAYPEQYTVWHLANAPVISPNITLTKVNMIRF